MMICNQGEDGWTPLFRASYNNRLELVTFLVENGASIGRDADEWQNTPLHACAINGHAKVAQYLINQGADVNEADNAGRWTPLYAASYFGWPEVSKKFKVHCLPHVIHGFYVCTNHHHYIHTDGTYLACRWSRSNHQGQGKQDSFGCSL